LPVIELSINSIEVGISSRSFIYRRGHGSWKMVGLTSAAGLVGFLSEPDPELRVFALKKLDEEIDLLWAEVADSVARM
jgi:26S proteasome regulatory subunit N2